MHAFKSGMIVGGTDFCGRDKEIRELSRLIKAKNRTYIYGERRIGKTSLVLETASRLNMNILHIDLMGIKTEDDLCRRFIKSIISFYKKSDSALLKILKQFATLRPNIGLDPMSNLPSIGLAPSPELNINDLEAAFDTMMNLRKTFVFVDEFQDILSLPDSDKIMAVMRSKIQNMNKLAFVFSGSIRNQMISIFTREDAPFYKSSFPINLKNIEVDPLTHFIQGRFKKQKHKVTLEFAEKIIDICDGIPGDIMRLCEGLVFAADELKSKDINYKILTPALEHIYALEKPAYEMMIQELSVQQMKTLTALAKIGCPSKISKELIEQSGITLAGSVNKAMKALLHKRIVTEADDKYKFSNPFFRSYILTNL